MNLLTGNHVLSRVARIRRLRKRTRAIREQRAFASGALSGALTGAAAGAILAFFADPQQGHRRRVIARDRTMHTARRGVHAFDVARRDLAHRLRGLAPHPSEQRPADADDSVISQRVRSALGRVISHPHAVEVTASEGAVTLRGQILRRELSAALAHSIRVRGVRHVENLLDIHETADHVPALQGGKLRRERFELLQERWAPGPRLAASVAGASLLGIAATSRHRRLRWPAAVLGSALLARSLSNTPISALLVQLPSRLFGQEQLGAARRLLLAVRPDQLKRRIDEHAGQEQR